MENNYENEDGKGREIYTFYNLDFSELNDVYLNKYSAGLVSPDNRGFMDIHPVAITVNSGSFESTSGAIHFPTVEVAKHGRDLSLTCPCPSRKQKLCEHQAQVLYNIIHRNELRIFFDDKLREEQLKRSAAAYGLQHEMNPGIYFKVEYHNRKAVITPKLKDLYPVNKETIGTLQQQLLPERELPFIKDISDNSKMFVVFKQHKYYRHLHIELYGSPVTVDGKIKNPLHPIEVSGHIWNTDNSAELKFFTAVTRFQNNFTTPASASEIEALKAIIKNPLSLAFYYHDNDVSENITAASLVPFRAVLAGNAVSINVIRKTDFHEISGSLTIQDIVYDLKDITIRYDYFLVIQGSFYLLNNFHLLKVIAFFKKSNGHLLIHQSQFEEFQQQVLNKLADSIEVSYHYLEPATDAQLQQHGFNEPVKKLIYLSDLGNYVMINPVMRYGQVEIPVLTKRQVYAADKKGNAFMVNRDDDAEIRFTAILLQQHPDFYEQLDGDLPYFYLHKTRFMEEAWFLNAFERWEEQDITVLGFNELAGNKLNPTKATISIKVISGINWFNTIIDVRFGKKKASLKQLQKSIANKNKFVQLDDGTLGILPAEWMEKFADYFYSGEAADEVIRTPKINYATITQLYAEDQLDPQVKAELKEYQEKLSGFESVTDVPVPETFQGTLRHYQQQGLNWLNFLDDFNFGGILADDMGLGKSIQIIAFILTQRSKVKRNTNLLVVPTSLIFNWQAEISKFAPTMRVHTIYGAGRARNINEFDKYEVILTSYNTLLSDIGFMKAYEFNYIFLDESQHIKNPESQRYQAVCTLRSRNKIAITGTPVENNTYDLYGQLSFACPGLLGSKQHFRDIYSVPIDRFKNTRRSIELQQKIDPFVLRRTKSEVAKELPDKTEMVIYCEMGEAQRTVYDIYEKELREFIEGTSDDMLSKSSMHVLKGLTRLRQICDSPVLLNDEKLHGDTSSKMDALIEQIENKSSQHKILVFSQFVSMLHLIKKQLEKRQISFQYLAGNTRNRDAVVNDFQENADVRVFLISLKAGGTGLNLTEADYVFLVDPWWNPAVENQAIDRCYRIGQSRHVVAVRLICPNTVEEKIMQLQDTKRDLVKDLIKTDGSALKSLSRSALLELLR